MKSNVEERGYLKAPNLGDIFGNKCNVSIIKFLFEVDNIIYDNIEKLVFTVSRVVKRFVNICVNILSFYRNEFFAV